MTSLEYFTNNTNDNRLPTPPRYDVVDVLTLEQMAQDNQRLRACVVAASFVQQIAQTKYPTLN